MSEQKASPTNEGSREVPPDGVAGLIKYWKSDLLSGFLVFLIALPLCLGISVASGYPPVAGILTAIVGGVLATFLGSAPLTIKGPAAGLIVIAVGAYSDLGGEHGGYQRALAVGVVAAAIQIAFALLRAGKLGDFFPASVVHGMLAAIGVIIFAKQAHTVLGVNPAPPALPGHPPVQLGPFELLAKLPNSVMHMNPQIALIGVICLAILLLMPLQPVRWIRKVPAPMVVLIVGVLLGHYLMLGTAHHYTFSGADYAIDPTKALVHLPSNQLFEALTRAITLPNFDQIFTPTSIKYIVMFSLVGSLESLLSTKAVDILDPYQRRSNLDRDLLALGIGNLIAAAIGGLPMISEIVRSSANVNNGGKTRFANFFHGLFLLLCVALIPGLLEQIPMAALAAMLVYVGLRLASPKEFLKTFKIGWEQLLIFCFTLGMTLATDLLIGVASGVGLKLLIHFINGLPIKAVFSPDIQETRDGQTVTLRVRHAAVFSNYLGIRRRIEKVDKDIKTIVLDLDDTRLVDHTVMEHLHHLADEYKHAGRNLDLHGLDQHQAFSAHDLAARRKRAAPA